jgi:hypothetical protein
VVRTARKRRPVRGSTNSELTSERDDSVMHETRATTSRPETPGVKAADDTWLTVASRAPVDYPDDYHGLLTALPQVQSIKPPDWLENGLNAEGVDQLPEPDRIIAAAMSWNAEDYAQTKCNFFNQYDPTIRDQSRWLRILKFGGSKPKEKGERLLAMWESLGWLETPGTAANNTTEHHPTPITPKVRTSASRSAKKVNPVEEKDASSKRSVVWTPEENDAMNKIMDALDKDSTLANKSFSQRADVCKKRLKTQFGTDRTLNAITIRYFQNRREREAVQSTEDTNTLVNSAAGGSLQSILLNAPLAARLSGTEFTAINDPVRNAVTNDDRIDSAAPSSTGDMKKKPERWTEQEDATMTEIYKEMEEDSGLSRLNANDRSIVCSARLLSRYGIERSANSVKQRWRRINAANNTPAKRKSDDVDDPNDDSEPLLTRQKRRQTVSRFVAELFNAEEE